MWINVKDRLPKETGQYKVKCNNGNSIAFFTRTLSGRLKWLCVNEDYHVIEWKDYQK